MRLSIPHSEVFALLEQVLGQALADEPIASVLFENSGVTVLVRPTDDNGQLIDAPLILRTIEITA